jgi:hypothetical protein
MSIKISKAEFDALPDAVKAKFEVNGDAYVLQEEDVEGLKKSKAEILAEKKRIQDERDELAKFKADADAKAAEDEEAKLKAAGETDKWKEQYDTRHKLELEKAGADKDALFADVHRERLTNELVKRGVLPDRADYLVNDLLSTTELFKQSETGKYDLRKKGGIGDAAEFDLVIDAAKQKSPFFFAASGASGSGASGSQQSSGTGNQIKRSQYDANPMQYAAALGKGEIKVVPD